MELASAVERRGEEPAAQSVKLAERKNLECRERELLAP